MPAPLRPLAPLAAVLLAACAMEPRMSAPPPGLDGTTWLLAALGEEAPPTPVSLNFAGDRVTGEAPCNRFMGGFAETAGALSLGPIAATRRACPHLDYEARFLSRLTDVAGSRVEGATLVLLDADGAPLMRLSRA